MSISEYIENMQKIQVNLLDYLDNENIIEPTSEINDIINELKMHDNKYEIKSFLHLFMKITNNHRRGKNFFTKVESILRLFKDNIPKHFRNSDIFDIFKRNKRILLFLLEEKLLVIDEYIFSKMISNKYLEAKYPQYFSPEIQPFINEKWFQKSDNSIQTLIKQANKEIPEDFYEQRKIGENDSEICEIIRQDSIDDFIKFINLHSIPVKSNIDLSIYETNPCLLKNSEISLIEYATFYGSIRIFKYLQLNDELITISLIKYAIYSQNAEIIQIIEEKCLSPDFYKICFMESIKCHNNNIADYFYANHYATNDENNLSNHLIDIFKYWNFAFMKNEFINESSFYYGCTYDYYILINLIKQNFTIDINKPMISTFFKMKF